MSGLGARVAAPQAHKVREVHPLKHHFCTMDVFFTSGFAVSRWNRHLEMGRQEEEEAGSETESILDAQED